MNDLDRYLLPTEIPEVVTRRHWASLTRAGSIFLGLILLGVFMVSALGDTQFFSTAGVVTVLGDLGWFGWVILDWSHERFVITDKRVLLISGLLTRKVAIMPLSKVTDLTYERSLMGRILGYGVFVMESAGQQQALSRIDYLPTPDQLYHQVSALLFGPRSRPWASPDHRTERLNAVTEQNTTPLPRLR
jgi:membrane protein YdbS with pleckstrin-like domain